MDYRSLIKSYKNRSISDDDAARRSRAQLNEALDRNSQYDFKRRMDLLAQDTIDYSKDVVLRSARNLNRTMYNTFGKNGYDEQFTASDLDLEEIERKRKQLYEEDVNFYFSEINDKNKERYKQKLLDDGWEEDSAQLLTDQKYLDIARFLNQKPALVDAVNQFAINMNTSQLEAFRGLIQRSSEYINDVNAFSDYIDKVQEKINIKKEENRLSTVLRQTTDPILRLTIQNQILNLKKNINDLDTYLENNSDIVKRIYDETNPSFLGFSGWLPERIGGGIKELGKDISNLGDAINIEKILGDIVGFKDEMYDVSQHMRNVTGNSFFGLTEGGFYEQLRNAVKEGNTSKAQESIDKIKNTIGLTNKIYSEKIKLWQEGIENNNKDLEQYNVSDYWKFKEANTELSLFNPKTWFRKLPGLMGSSAGSWHKQIGSLGLAFVPGGGQVGMASKALTMFGLNYSAGQDENNMEVAMAVKERLQDELKKAKQYDALIQEGRRKLKGGNGLSEELIFDAFIDKQFSTANTKVDKITADFTKNLSQLYSRDMVATTSDALIDTMLELIPLGKVAKASKFASSSGKAFLRGMTLGPVAGALNIPLHAALRPVENYASKLIKNVGDEILKTGKILGNTNTEVVLNYAKALKRGTNGRYIKDISGRVITAHISEGIEEGKQYINAEKYKKGEYDKKQEGLVGMLLDDFLAASKSAQVMLGIPLGLVPEEDHMLSQEILGGMLLGGAHVAIATGGQSAIPWVREQLANNVVINNVLADKINKIDSFQKGINYSKAAQNSQKSQFVLQAFDRLKELNEQSRNDNDTIDQEFLDQERATFNRIVNISNDPVTRIQAEGVGIDKKSDKYHEYVSGKGILLTEYQEALEAYDNARNAVNEIESTLAAVFAQENPTSYYITEDLQNAPVITNPNTFNVYNRNIARLSAALKYKQLLEEALSANEYNPNKNVSKQIRTLLNNVNEQISEIKKVTLGESIGITEDTINEDTANFEALGIEENVFSELRNAYLNEIKAYSDILLTEDLLEEYLGTPAVKLKDGNVVSIEEYVEKPNEDQIGDLEALKQHAENVKNIKRDLLTNASRHNWMKYIRPKDELVFVHGKGSSIIDKFKTLENNDDWFLYAFMDIFDQTINPQPDNTEDETDPQLFDGEDFEQPEQGTQEQPLPKRSYITPEINVRPKARQPEQLDLFNLPVQPSSKKEKYILPEITITQQQGITNAQLLTIDKLKNISEKNSANILTVNEGESKEGKYFTTSEDYFVKVDGKVRRASRVHSILPEGWRMERDLEVLYKEILAELKQKQGDTDALIDAINLLEEKHGKNEDLEAYRTYIKDGGLFDKNETNITIEHIAKIISNKERPNYVSLKVGNIFDDIVRTFYQLDYPLLHASVIFDHINKQENKTIRQLFKDDVSLLEFIDTLVEIYDFYKNTLGWEIISTPTKFVGSFDKIGLVCGETDLLGVDKQGNVHIIDVKTTYMRRLNERRRGNKESIFLLDLNDEYKSQLDAFNKDDFNKGSNKKGVTKRVRDLLKDVREKTGEHNLKITWSGSRAVFVLNKDSFLQKNYDRLQVSTFKEYSNQQTAYKMLIEYTFDDVNVQSIELMLFGVEYGDPKASNARDVYLPINKVKYSGRNMLLLSSSVLSLFGNNAPQQDVEENKPSVLDLEEQEVTVQEPEPQAVAATNKNPKVNHGYVNLDYYQVSRMKDFGNATNNPSFLTDSKWRVYIENGYLYADIEFNGTEYKHINIKTTDNRGNWTNEGIALFKQADELSKELKHGEFITVSNISRTNGRMQRLTGDNYQSVTNTDLISTDIYDIEFNSLFGYGFVNGTNVETLGPSGSRPIIYSYPTDGSVPIPENGTLVILKQGNNRQFPVSLRLRKFTETDVDFVLECLLDRESLYKPHIIYIDGEVYNIEATKRQLLNLLIPIVDDANNVGTNPCILINSSNPNLYSIRSLSKVYGEYNLATREGVLKLREDLLSLSIVDNKDVHKTRIGSDTSSTFPFKSLRSFWTKFPDKSIVKISDSLVFDKNDFLPHTSTTSGTTYRGLSGLGWYIKNNLIQTLYAGMIFANVSIQGLQKNTDIKTASGKNIIDDIQSTNLDDMLFRVKAKNDENKQAATKEEIERIIHSLLGDTVDLLIVDDIISVLKDAPAGAVGATLTDVIYIANGSWKGVAYHEAFHRILELLVDEKTLNKLYNTYAKRLGLDLSKIEHYRTIAEYMADEYELYSENANIKTNRISDSFIGRLFNRIYNYIKALRHIGNYRLYKLFLDINSGRYRNIKTISKSRKERFEKLYSLLYFDKNGHHFEHILNDKMYDQLLETVKYCVILGQSSDVTDIDVQNMNVSKEAFENGINKLIKRGNDVLGKNSEERTIGQKALNEILDNFEYVRKDVVDEISTMSTKYNEIEEEKENNENREGDLESVVGSSIGEHTKNSYEFDRFEKASSLVKYFFNTISSYERVLDGRELITVLKKNELGLPQFEDGQYVFNLMLNQFRDIESIEDLLSRLVRKNNILYRTIFRKIRSLQEAAINGNVNAEAFLAQLFITIKSSKHQPKIIKLYKDGDLRLIESNQQYQAKNYIKSWNFMLYNGGTSLFAVSKNGKLQLSKSYPNAQQVIKAIADMWDSSVKHGDKIVGGILQLFSETAILNRNVYFKTKIKDENGKYTPVYINDVTKDKNITLIKNKIVESLNWLGINISNEEFDHMLDSKYGSTDYLAVKQMLESSQKTDSIGTFIDFIHTAANDPGKIGKNIYERLSFVLNLANWKYSYKHQHFQNESLTVNGNRVFENSDNNFITDRTLDLNTRGDSYKDLLSYCYCYSKEQVNDFGDIEEYGSFILKQMQNDPNIKLQLVPFGGFKTNQKSDQGLDYFEIQHVEDYISKLFILENDGVVFPTLESKKTYYYLTGIKLPGIDYSSVDLPKPSYIIQPDEKSQLKHAIVQDENVINQFISYAYSEYNAIKQAIEELETIEDIDKVDNFHTFAQGAKFSTLLGVYEYQYDDNKNIIGEKFISFNDNKHDLKSLKDKLLLAEQHFFSIPREHQLIKIARLLQDRLDDTLKNAEELGLIKKIKYGVGEDAHYDSNPYFNFKNLKLPKKGIQSIFQKLISKIENPTTTQQNQMQSLAICMYLMDLGNKHIMSVLEFERLYSGNPSFYSWIYNKDGSLKDRTTDEIKRLGGTISTGQNNYQELKNKPRRYSMGNYNVSQIRDEFIASPLEQLLKSLIYPAALLRAAIDADIASIDVIETMSEQQIEDELNKINSTIVPILKKQSSDSLKKYTKNKNEKGINVTDGASYITDDMCEVLLRMNGKYPDDVKEAFDILRDTSITDLNKKSSAYQKVITTVIGSQKYTAFGHRKEGNKLVPYFMKTALFPIFPSIATGKLKNIYDAMKRQNVDVLCLNSAIKVGGRGSQSINYDEYSTEPGDKKPLFEDSFKFHKWSAKFSELRKQLNTDAHEEVDQMKAGTQMQKVLLQNIIPDRPYTTPDGRRITGSEMLLDIMKNIKGLSDHGKAKIERDYFSEGDVDIEKLSKELDRLTSGGSIDRNTKLALELEKVDDVYRFKTPLQSQSSLSFLESKIIANVNKEVVDVNLTGSAFIQRSVFLMEGKSMLTKMTDENVPVLNNGEKLKLINEHGSMDCVLSIDYYLRQKTADGKPLIPETPLKDKNGKPIWYTDEKGNRKVKTRKKSFEEARNWLIKKGIIGGNSTAIMYRIPTQGISSIFALRCVDVIPIVNDTIILPAEITTVTGSDFKYVGVIKFL